MRVFDHLKMKSSCIILDEMDSFPTNPGYGTLAFKQGVLYIYASVSGVDTWYPLTNKVQHYTHNQGVVAQDWSIVHGLQTEDVIAVVYDGNDVQQLYSSIEFVNENEIIIHFAEATSGRAVIFGASDAYAPAVTTSEIHTGDLVVDDSVTFGGIDFLADYNTVKTKLNSMFDYDDATGKITFKGDFVPSNNETYSIGSPTNKVKDLYVSASTIHLGDNTTFDGTAVTVDAGENPDSLTDKPTLQASALIAKPFKYNPGTGDIWVRPEIKFQDRNGINYPISFDTENAKFSFDADGNYGQGTIVAKNAEIETKVTCETLETTGSAQVLFNQDFRADGNVILGYDDQNTVSVKGILDIQQPITFTEAATLGDGNDNIAVNCGAANDFTVSAQNLTVDGTGVTIPHALSVGSDLAVTGNLVVNGTTTTVNTTELDVADNTIVLNDGETASGVSAGSAGIEIDRGSLNNAKVYFNETDDKWYMSNGGSAVAIAGTDIRFDSRYLRKDQSTAPSVTDSYDLGSDAKKFANVYATNFNGDVIGNATSADKLSTARAIALSGDVTGSISFDGSQNVTISTTVVDGSHSHDTQYFTQTAADSRYLRRDQITTPSVTDSYDLGSTSKRFRSVYAQNFKGKSDTAVKLSNARTISLTGGVTGSVSFDGSNDVSIAANVVDGPGSGLNADLLDGNDASAFASASHDHDTKYLRQDASSTPDANNSINLGSSSYKFANVYATTFHGALNGNADTATKLGAARTIGLSGDLTGSASFDGSSNVTINAQLDTSVFEPNYTQKNVNYTASNQDCILANTSAGSFTVTLPGSPNQYDRVTIVDVMGTFETNNLIVARNGQNILGDGENLTLDVNFYRVDLIYLNASEGWVFI